MGFKRMVIINLPICQSDNVVRIHTRGGWWRLKKYDWRGTGEHGRRTLRYNGELCGPCDQWCMRKIFPIS